MQICYISDAKAGHQAQVMGLVSALSALVNVELTTLTLSGNWLSRWQIANTALPTPPDLIIGAGHSTHIPVWLMGRRYRQAKTLIVMKPSLPLSWFDFVMMPEHDAKGSLPSHVLLTQGVMNRFVNEQRHQANKVLILLGGTNQRYAFDSQKMLADIQTLIEHYQDINANVIMTDSRRTPTELSNCLSKKNNIADLSTFQFFPVANTTPDWLNEQYQTASHVWVTADSVNMIFEAMTAGCQVGLIELPKLKTDRVTNMVDSLIQSGKVTTLNDFRQGKSLPNAMPINEAKRAAQWLLSKLNVKLIQDIK